MKKDFAYSLLTAPAAPQTATMPETGNGGGMSLGWSNLPADATGVELEFQSTRYAGDWWRIFDYNDDSGTWMPTNYGHDGLQWTALASNTQGLVYNPAIAGSG
ncbi:MAG: hypothetical protein JO353_07285, partial [Phycisphaerae bacterium]|nr:hypothetical protein [Phycisphaerae bacterium]